MKNINRERFFISFMIIAVTSFLSFTYMMGYKDDVFGYSWIARSINYVFNIVFFVLAFPDVVFFLLHKFQDTTGFLVGIVLGALFYSFIIELIFIKYRTRGKSEI